MADKPWKAFERKMAATFFTTRRLLKGTNEKSDIGDDNYPLCLDCKLRAQWSIVSWWNELEVYSRDSDKIPVLVVRRSGKRKAYAFIEIEYAKVWGILVDDAISVFWVERPGPSGKWDIEAHYEAVKKRANLANRIPILVVERQGGPVLAVLDPEHLASLLKGCGIIGQEDV